MINLLRMRTLIGYEQRLKFRYERKLSKAAKITSVLTGMPRGSGTNSQVEAGAIELSEVRDAYAEVLEELKSMRGEMIPLLRALENPDDIAVMRLRYLDGYSLRDIPDAVCLSERAMFYHLASAEKKLAQMFPEQVTIR